MRESVLPWSFYGEGMCFVLFDVLSALQLSNETHLEWTL